MDHLLKQDCLTEALALAWSFHEGKAKAVVGKSTGHWCSRYCFSGAESMNNINHSQKTFDLVFKCFISKMLSDLADFQEKRLMTNTRYRILNVTFKIHFIRRT